MDTADHKVASLSIPTSPLPEIEPEASTTKLVNELSCSSSDSDTDDLFQIDAPEFAHLPPVSTGEALLIDVVPNNVDGSPFETNVREMRLPTEYHGSRSEEQQSPVVQVMERNEIADPDRIPSSVFARSPPTPMEWSVASNESLFSITMGSMSFTGDQVFLMGRSGDLGGFIGGLMDRPSPFPPSMSPAVSPVIAGENGRGAIVDLCTLEEAAATANAEAMRDVMRVAVEEKERERDKQASALLDHSISRHSGGSASSFRSFVFPILSGDGRIGSTKAESVRHNGFHPFSRAAPRKAAVKPPPAAAAPTSSQGPAPASIQSTCFSCFSCCRC